MNWRNIAKTFILILGIGLLFFKETRSYGLMITGIGIGFMLELREELKNGEWWLGPHK